MREFGVQAMVSYGKLEAVCREMAQTLERTSRSPLISRDARYATGVLTGDAEVAAQHLGDPTHLYALTDSVRSLLEAFAYDLADGDVLLVANPYQGGTEGCVLTMAAPVFYEGELLLLAAARARVSDLAGEYPGNVHPLAFESWQENLLLSPVRLYHRGVLQRDLWRFLLANSRAPTRLEWDLRAMHACCQSAREQLLDLLRATGVERVTAAVQSAFGYARRRVSGHLAALPATACTAEVRFAGDGPALLVRACVHRKDGENGEGAKVRISLEGSGGPVHGPFNVPLSATKAYAVWPLLAPLADDVPLNAGALDAFEVVAPAGSLVHPLPPAATGLGGVLTGHLIAEAVTCALVAGGCDPAVFAGVHGPAPAVELFEPVGTAAETPPVAVAPGYPTAVGGWGPPLLHGGGRLSSAEELEAAGGLRILARERDDDAGGMRVVLENTGKTLHANISAPRTGASPAAVRLVAAGEEVDHGTRSDAVAAVAVEAPLAPGARLIMHYPAYGRREAGDG